MASLLLQIKHLVGHTRAPIHAVIFHKEYITASHTNKISLFVVKVGQQLVIRLAPRNVFAVRPIVLATQPTRIECQAIVTRAFGEIRPRSMALIVSSAIRWMCITSIESTPEWFGGRFNRFLFIDGHFISPHTQLVVVDIVRRSSRIRCIIRPLDWERW